MRKKIVSVKWIATLVLMPKKKIEKVSDIQQTLSKAYLQI